jgi:hypothetical protein
VGVGICICIWCVVIIVIVIIGQIADWQSVFLLVFMNYLFGPLIEAIFLELALNTK